MSERITEEIVRTHLQKHPTEDYGMQYSEQIPHSRQIKKLLLHASKSGPGRGRPEFIITFEKRPEFLIVVECKASIRNHQSRNKDKPKDFAVDGALHYAKYLAKEFNVLAIAVSGTKMESLRVSHFIHFKEDENEQAIFGPSLLSFEDYIKGYLDHGKTLKQDVSKLLSFTQEPNQELHDFKIEEANRSLLISAILVALKDESFRKSYESEKPSNLLERVKSTTLHSMKEIVKPDVFKNIKPTYSFMDADSQLDLGSNLIELIKGVDEKINSFEETHQYYDYLGQFYIEFLRYSNSDKGLGIVLTPPHITDFAARLAAVNKDDIVYDNCAGTGGFLISSMKLMIESAEGNQSVENKIRQKGIIGVEIQSSKASLLCSNMFIHKDGRSNVIKGNCFKEEIQRQVKEHKPTVGLLNPPFKRKGANDDEEELRFVLNNLNALKPKGRCVALLPMQCAIATRGNKCAFKEKLLEQHTLEAVLSLPDQLFHNSNVNVVTCLMVFTAHQPHPKKGKKTWFGYCKDDGYIIKKPKGRIDHNSKWEDIRDNWLNGYKNREEKAGFSIKKEVGADDEWCAEAYMETDYSTLNKNDFQDTLKRYVAFKVLNGD